MLRARWYVALAAGWLLAVFAAGAAESLRPPRYPWHLADVWWHCRNPSTDVQEIRIDVRIAGKIDDAVDLYIAPLGLAKLNAVPIYGGVQTATFGWPSKESRARRRIGRGGIFSRWSVDDAPIPLAYADGADDTHYEAADYEKNFLSVRRRVEWREGDYTYAVRRLRVDSGETAPHAWFGAFVTEKASGKETFIGALRLDGTAFPIDRAVASFVEVYGRRSAIPEVTVAFSEPRIDAQACASERTHVNYPRHGIADAPRFATSRRRGDAVEVTTDPLGRNDGVISEAVPEAGTDRVPAAR